ncbi:MAG: OmpA family protein [Pseudomonadota bacterium]
MTYSKLWLATIAISFMVGAPSALADEHRNASKSEAVGVGTGAVIGGAVGGPVGAIIGAAIGGHYGHTVNESNEQMARADDALDQLASSRRQLDQTLTEQERLDLELLAAHDELDALNARIETLFVERALVDGLQFDVHFDTDQSTLSDDDRQRLVRLSALIKALPDAEIAVHGFADSRGDDAHNEVLSMDRAYTVADTLNALGIPGEQISTAASGESQATYSGENTDAYSHDRRVSIRLDIPEKTNVDVKTIAEKRLSSVAERTTGGQ